MIRIYIKTAFRNLRKNKAFTTITIFGLTIGMAVCIMLSAHVIGEYSYDEFWENSEKIYRVNHTQFKNGVLQFESARTFNGLPLAVETEFPEVKYATGLQKDVITVYTPEVQIKDMKMFWTDTCLFKVFKFNIVYGSVKNPFPDMYSVVISQSMATSLFGNIDPTGLWFKLNEGWQYHVTAVFEDIPKHSHIEADCFFDMHSLFFHLQNFDNTTRQMRTELGEIPQNVRRGSFRRNVAHVYVLLNDKVDAGQITEKFPALFKKYAPDLKERKIVPQCHLQAISEIHLNSQLSNEIRANGDKDFVIALIIIAIIISTIAWINFVNLTLIRGLEQSKTIGIHKIMGAQRGQIINQYLIESFLLNLASICTALILVFFLKEWYSRITGVQLNLSFHWLYYVYFTIALLPGILISGLYPAIILSAVRPIELFSKLKHSSGKSIDLRKVLVVLQFTATAILIVGTITVFRQVNHMKNQELGMNIDQTLVSFSPMSMIQSPDLIPKLLSFKAEIKKLSGVKGITTSSSIPGKEIEFKNDNVRRAESGENYFSAPFYLLNTDHDFLNTFEIKLLAGSYFTKTDQTQQNDVVINTEALSTLGFSSPIDAIGQSISIGNSDFNIKGVVANHHHETLRKEIVPIIFRNSYRWNHEVGYYSFKITSGNMQETIDGIEEVWKRFYPQDHFEFFFLDEAFNDQYRQYNVFGNLFGTFSFLAIIIACSGLLGLAVYAASKRQKEIGIRKVNGATVFEILIMLNRDFIKWVVLAFVIACPIAYYIMNSWLENFAYKTTLGWWIFAFSGVLALGISMLTVSWQSWQAAIKNPVEALRNE